MTKQLEEVAAGGDEKRAAPDPELSAIRRIISILEGLPGNAAARVLGYVRHRYDDPALAVRQTVVDFTRHLRTEADANRQATRELRQGAAGRAD